MSLNSIQSISIVIIIVISISVAVFFISDPSGDFKRIIGIEQDISKAPSDLIPDKHPIEPIEPTQPPVPASTGTEEIIYFHMGSMVASKTNSENTVYYIQDHLGSNMKIVDGQLEQQDNKYYPFGETQTTGESENDYKYTGKELDQESGLYYYGARYYKPEVGRFMQPDMVIGGLDDPLSLNRYAYVKNNPIRYIDVTGNAGSDFAPTIMTKHYEMTGAQHTKSGVPKGPALIAIGMLAAPFVAYGVGAAATCALTNPITATSVGVAAVETAVGYDGPSPGATALDMAENVARRGDEVVEGAVEGISKLFKKKTMVGDAADAVGEMTGSVPKSSDELMGTVNDLTSGMGGTRSEHAAFVVRPTKGGGSELAVGSGNVGHPSLAGSGDVHAAGEMWTEGGTLMVSRKSGHYQPTEEQWDAVKKHLDDMDIEYQIVETVEATR